jgi:hypothetical protein
MSGMAASRDLDPFDRMLLTADGAVALPKPSIDDPAAPMGSFPMHWSHR